MDLDFSNLTEELIDQTVSKIINLTQTFNDNILTLDSTTLTWNNYIDPDIANDHQMSKLMCLFQMSSFHTDKTIRQKCSDADTQLSKFFIDQSMRKDLFNQFKTYYDTTYQTEKLDPSIITDERKHYIENRLLDYSLSGMLLDDESYERVKVIRMELSELSNQFDLNLSNENSSYVFTKDDLDGMSEDYLTKRLNSDDTNYTVTLKYPDYVPIMEKCRNRETRKRMAIAYGNRCVEENMPICIKVFKLREQLAKLFGYEQYSDMALIKRMAKDTHTVMDFLNNLKDKMKSMSRRDLNYLQEVANQDNINSIEPYDVSYYSNIYKEKNAELDEEELRKHFPLETVTNGMFNIYETLLSYKFVEITEPYRHQLWHEDVKLYKVLNNNNGNILGYFYLDLFPREGKYGHAAVFPFVSKSRDNLPVVCMACNFGKNETLRFSEVETYFHEFGHVMHGISSNTEIGQFAGTQCERDFVEAPSQMLEEWCYQPTSLKLMSLDMTDDLIAKINKKEKMLQGYHYARQLSFGLYDMYLHSAKLNTVVSDSNTLEENSLNLASLFNDVLLETVGLGATPNTNFISGFGHIMHGYAAGYYGYLWSLVYAKDMFYSKFKNHELDPNIGNRYKTEILSYGGSRPSIESLRIFLGREPNSDAFFESL